MGKRRPFGGVVQNQRMGRAHRDLLSSSRLRQSCYMKPIWLSLHLTRGNLPGVVLIQTIQPDHYAVRLAGTHDYQAFYERELEFRRSMRYPPFSAMANLLVRSEKQEVALRMSADLGHFLTPPPEQLKILGPAEAPVPRLKNEYRYQFLIKAANRAALSELLHRARHFALDRKWGATALVIDVDPVTLM